MYRPGIGEVELPTEIERALEEQRLVFFCGAGISVYTGLPLFKQLVEKVCRRTCGPIDELTGDELEPVKDAFRAKQYDRALGLLEQAVTEWTMRREVINQLTTSFRGELAFHKAILDLARVSGGGYHLVTTNFDDRFCSAGLEEAWIHDAPRLAPPRPQDWHHATYLHGRVKPDDPDGRQLVLTSADFGRAYLEEGWAARFVVELFREFTILFIGYSVEDPVMSYLVDALAAHRRQSRQFKSAFALIGFDVQKPDDLDKQVRAWRAKNIEPIPFPKAGRDDYSAMNAALIAWAEDCRLGLQSRINTALRATTQAYLQRDREAEQVVWALSRHDGSVAKAFASAEQPADPSWLKAFDEIEIPQADGQRFKLTSFPCDPASGNPMLIANPLAGPATGRYAPHRLSPVTHQIGLWISKHLDRDEVVQWAAHQQGMLHPDLAGVIAWRMQRKDCEVSELKRRFWSIVIMEADRRVLSIFDLLSLSRIMAGSTYVRRRVIVDSLEPTLRIARSHGFWFGEQGQIRKTLRDLVHLDIEVNDRDGLIVGEGHKGVLPDEDLRELSDELTSLLVTALQLGHFWLQHCG